MWHVNEGHAAFQVVERIHEYILQDMDFATALELMAANTVFTTHTPVPAGHDIFDNNLIREYFSSYFQELDITPDTFLTLGHSEQNQTQFNMTSLALRTSRLHNGVSRIHGDVASRMEAYIWPDIPASENPIRYVTNGVHVPTFLAHEWANLFDARFRQWRSHLSDPEFWNCLDSIKDYRYWSIHRSLRAELLKDIHKRIERRYRRNGCSETLIRKTTRHLKTPDADILVLGFARRFATYKRASLLFANEERLKKLLNDPQRPVMLVFAGKAHPQDDPGQQLIKTIHHYSQHPDFCGKVLLLEDYDMALARKLVTGVDVWINTPEYPLEACGTSGQKAGINGVLNLSVLDGWWGEGYNGQNGWAVVPHEPHYDAHYRNHEEASDLIDILEQQVIPSYYDRDSLGYSNTWIAMCKEAMKSTIPRFNSERMVMDYVQKFYRPAIQQQQQLLKNNHQAAEKLAQWKQKIHANWSSVSLKLLQEAPDEIAYESNLELTVSAKLGKLSPEDVRVELLIGEKNGVHEEFAINETHLFKQGANTQEPGIAEFTIALPMNYCGLQHYKIRIYPYHALLAHPLELGYMRWL